VIYSILNPFIDFEDFSEVVGGNHWTMEEAQQFCAQLGQTFPDPGPAVAGCRGRGSMAHRKSKGQ
jgi:hypothetical protein